MPVMTQLAAGGSPTTTYDADSSFVQIVTMASDLSMTEPAFGQSDVYITIEIDRNATSDPGIMVFRTWVLPTTVSVPVEGTASHRMVGGEKTVSVSAAQGLQVTIGPIDVQDGERIAVECQGMDSDSLIKVPSYVINQDVGVDPVALNDLSASDVYTQVNNALDVEIPGSPTADSVNERLQSLDVLLETAGAGDAAATLTAATALDTLLKAAGDGDAAAIKTKTDQLVFTTTNKVDSRVDNVGTNIVTSPDDFKADVSALALDNSLFDPVNDTVVLSDGAAGSDAFRNLFPRGAAIYHGYVPDIDAEAQSHTTSLLYVGPGSEGQSPPLVGSVDPADWAAYENMEVHFYADRSGRPLKGVIESVVSATFGTPAVQYLAVTFKQPLDSVPPNGAELIIGFPDVIYYIVPGSVANTFTADVVLTRRETPVTQDEYEVSIRDGAQYVAADSDYNTELWIYEFTGAGGMPFVQYIGDMTTDTGQSVVAREGVSEPTDVYTHVETANRIPAGHNVRARVQATINGVTYSMSVPIVTQNTIT